MHALVYQILDAKMAYATIFFENPQSGQIKEAPVGFSWTTFFFGLFPALLRGHWVMVLVMFLLSIITFGLSWLVFPFIYNKMYVRYLIGEGFKAKGASQEIGALSQKIGQEIPVLSA